MAQQVVYTDDIDGTPDARTIQFALDKDVFEVDLSPSNILKLNQLLQPFIDAAHPASAGYRQAMTSPLRGRGAGGTPASRTRTKQERARTGDIRSWARTQGFEISNRGRIPAEIEDKYHAAHRTTL